MHSSNIPQCTHVAKTYQKHRVCIRIMVSQVADVTRMGKLQTEGERIVCLSFFSPIFLSLTVTLNFIQEIVLIVGDIGCCSNPAWPAFSGLPHGVEQRLHTEVELTVGFLTVNHIKSIRYSSSHVGNLHAFANTLQLCMSTPVTHHQCNYVYILSSYGHTLK